MFYIIFCLIIKIVYCYDSYTNFELPEGSKCMKNDIAGECVNMYRCPEVIVDRSWRKNPEVCSFDNLVPIVCCTSCSLVNNITDAVITPTGQLYWKTGSKAWDKCLEYSSTLPYQCKRDRFLSFSFNDTAECYNIGYASPAVFGGRNARSLEFPHMALLGYGQALKDAQWLCGGSVLSESFVLTAAHCISSPQLGAVSYVAVGILKRSSQDERSQTRRVTTVIPHPEYKAPHKYHDIAILKVDTMLTFNEAVLPACLPATALREEAADEDTIATGWGALGHHRDLAEHLQAVSLEERSSEHCARLYPPSRLLRAGFDPRTQLCAGDHTYQHADTCQGDSGGPLSYNSPSTCAHVVVGVTSYGRPCELRGGAGIYTRVTHYVPWIESIVWAE